MAAGGGGEGGGGSTVAKAWGGAGAAAGQLPLGPAFPNTASPSSCRATASPFPCRATASPSSHFAITGEGGAGPWMSTKSSGGLSCGCSGCSDAVPPALPSSGHDEEAGPCAAWVGAEAGSAAGSTACSGSAACSWSSAHSISHSIKVCTAQHSKARHRVTDSRAGAAWHRTPPPW